MKYLSLFTGIGGFELGIQQAHTRLGEQGGQTDSLSGRQETLNGSGVGNTQTKRNCDGSDESSPICVGFSEIDKYAIQIYQSHFPEHHNYGDITKINEEELPDFELLCGGFPCQSFSIAGKRGGFNDTRGTMFFHIARILAAKRPRLLLLENVKGLLSHDEGRTFATIISTLDELGYDIQWQVLNSKNHGVPQNRERVFIVGHLRGTRRREVFPFEGTNGQDTDIGKDAEFRAQGVATRHLNRNGSLISEHASTLQVAETPHVLVGTLRTHKDGNGFREMQSGLAPTIPARAREDGSGQPVVMVPEATKLGYAVAEEGDSINLAVPNSATRRGRVGKSVAQTLDTGMQQYTLTKINHANAQETRPSEILPPVRDANDTAAREGRGFNVSTPFLSNDLLRKGVHENGLQRETQEREPWLDDSALSREKSQTQDRSMRSLQREPQDGSTSQERGLEGQSNREFTRDLSRLPYETPSDGGKEDGLFEEESERSWSIRRLTEVECERLQGFPDNWTKFGADGKTISSTQRYKTLGNAVTVNVIEAVISKMICD